LAVLYRFRHDHAEEKAVLERGAAVGDRRSIYMLGMLYLNGPRQYRDLNLAVQTLYRSAQLGSTYAKRQLGWLYLSGRGGLWNIAYGIRTWLAGLRDAYRVSMWFWDQEQRRVAAAAAVTPVGTKTDPAEPERLKQAA
jgi:TPR repeat protein